MVSTLTISPELDAVEEAIRILMHADEAIVGSPLGPICHQWRASAICHLQRSVDRQLRDRPKIDSEQIFQAMLKDTAAELRQASVALESAARVLVEKGAIQLAKQIHAAGQRALKAAEGLVGA